MGTTAKKKKTLENLKDMIYKVSVGEIKCNPKVIEYENNDRVLKEENKIEEEKNKKIEKVIQSSNQTDIDNF